MTAPLKEIECRGDWVYRLAVSPNGDRVASVDDGINIFDVATGNHLGSLPKPDGQANALAFSPDGKLIAAAGGGDEFEWNHRIRVYDSHAFEMIAEWDCGAGMGSNVRMVRFSMDGTRLVSCGVNAQVRIWDASNWAMIHAFKGHEMNVQDAWLSADNSRIVSGGLDGRPRTWDVERSEEFATFADHIEGRNYAVAISPDAKIAVSGGGGQICAWDAATAETIASIDVGDAVNYLAFTPDGEGLIAVLWGGPFLVIDTSRWEILHRIDASSDRTHGHGLTLDGKTLVTASTAENKIKLWDIDALRSDPRAAFFAAIRANALDDVARMLAADPALTNSRMRGDATLLNEQVWEDKKRVSMSVDDTRDSPALHYAAFHGNVELAKLLLAHGADVNAIAYENNHEMTPPIVLAAWEGGLEILRLLLENGADPNARSSNGVTPLSTAIRHKKEDRVALLKQFGAIE